MNDLQSLLPGVPEEGDVNLFVIDYKTFKYVKSG